jgi:MerR family transcriptional regulator, thiopeptide resistance regulator
VAWSIAQVARMSGVTSRTLRHYDQIGLLSPASVGGNGYRRYGQDELLRLQQILVLRELGLGLADIGGILGAQTESITALRAHHARLLAERRRLGTLARTVATTIAALEAAAKAGNMTQVSNPENLFEGFDHSRYDAEARQRWGDEAVDEAVGRAGSAADIEHSQRQLTALIQRMGALMAQGAPADDPRVLDAVDEHFRWVCGYWTPSRESYAGLGELYVEDERFAANYEKVRPGLAAYMRDAMKDYARQRLS